MYVALDLETTGLSAQKDKIIEIAAIKMNLDGTIVEEFQTLVQPNVPLPEIIKNLTGITDEDLQGAPTIDDVREEVKSFIGDAPILGHSVQFDIDFLQENDIETPGTVLDTFQLAQTLLPNERSYSLEILSDQFDLVHESKHRALDDTKVAIELYKLLLEKIHEIPPKTVEKIRPILEKTDWGWKNTFLNNFQENATLAAAKEDSPSVQSGSHTLQKELLNSLSSGKSIIIEAPSGSGVDLAFAAAEFSESSGEKCLIATPEPQNITPDARVAHLQHPIRYLCTSALAAFTQKPSFQPHEARLLTKIFIWLNHTKRGEKNEIVIGDDEQGTWNIISAYPHLYDNASCDDPSCFYTQALETAQRASVLVVSHHLLTENIARQGALIPKKPHLLLESVETFEESALNAFTQYFSADNFTTTAQALGEEAIADRFNILFGLFGMFLENHAEKDAFARQVIFEEHHQGTGEWQKIKATFENLETSIQALPESPQTHILQARLKALQKALAFHPGLLTWGMLSFHGDPIIKSCPVNVGQLLSKMLWNQHQSLTILSAFGSLEGHFDFLKKRLQLPENLEETFIDDDETSKISLHLHPEFPDPKNPKNLSETTPLIERITKEGTTFLLVNALSAIDQLHDRLAKPLKEAQVLLLAQGITGGMGKITQQFTKAQDKTLIIGNEKLFRTVLASPAAEKIETLLIHRLPFLPPFHPVHQAEAKKLMDGFKEYSLPLAIIRFKKFIHAFETHTVSKEIHILDPRFENYNGRFLHSLPPTVQIV